MQRRRERICAASDLIVTPSAAILPPARRARRSIELEWGADTDRFHPGAEGPLPFARPPGMLAVFAGAFRNWHGAVNLARAIRELRRSGTHRHRCALHWRRAGAAARPDRGRRLENVVFTGAVPHDRMPACLAAADIGVAPFDLAAHKPLALGFYWSPLKIFEYMAAGLPVVAPAADRIPKLVEGGVEGLLYQPAAPVRASPMRWSDLTDATLRPRLGAAARDTRRPRLQLARALRSTRSRHQRNSNHRDTEAQRHLAGIQEGK